MTSARVLCKHEDCIFYKKNTIMSMQVFLLDANVKIVNRGKPLANRETSMTSGHYVLNAPSYPEVLLDLFHVVVVGQGGGSCTERRGIAIMIFCLSCAVLFSARECSIGNIAITAKNR